MKKIVISLLIVPLIFGCVTGTHIVTGQTRTPLKANQVRLYQVPPAKYEIVGIVNASTPGKGQRHMDDAVDQLKEQAAMIGANGVLIGSVNPGSESIGIGTANAYGGGAAFYGSGVSASSSGIQLSGQAIYVETTP